MAMEGEVEVIVVFLSLKRVYTFVLYTYSVYITRVCCVAVSCQTDLTEFDRRNYASTYVKVGRDSKVIDSLPEAGVDVIDQ